MIMESNNIVVIRLGRNLGDRRLGASDIVIPGRGLVSGVQERCTNSLQ